MLKIKEDKMKDLEKFGFKYKGDEYERDLRDYGFSLFAQIDKDNRCIVFVSNFGDDSYLPDENERFLIPELIKADMVEKVVEDEQI